MVARFTRAGQAREPFDGERGVPAASTFQFSIAFLEHSFALSLYLLFSLLGHVVGIHDFNRTCFLQRVEGKLQVSLKVRNLQHVHASCICQVCDVIQPESKAGHESFPMDGCTAAQPSLLFWTGENMHFVSFSSSNSADATWGAGSTQRRVPCHCKSTMSLRESCLGSTCANCERRRRPIRSRQGTACDASSFQDPVKTPSAKTRSRAAYRSRPGPAGLISIHMKTAQSRTLLQSPWPSATIAVTAWSMPTTATPSLSSRSIKLAVLPKVKSSPRGSSRKQP